MVVVVAVVGGKPPKEDPPLFFLPPSSSLLPLAPHATETGCKNRDDNDTLSCLRGEKRGREDDRDRVTSRTRVREVFILTTVVKQGCHDDGDIDTGSLS